LNEELKCLEIDLPQLLKTFAEDALDICVTLIHTTDGF